jgi:hypothetical protein
LIALALAAVYFLVYSTLSVLRHESYHSSGFDLGLFDQVFWNTTQGRPFESTMSQALPVPHSLLGDHFSPIFWVLMRDEGGRNTGIGCNLAAFQAQVASVEDGVTNRPPQTLCLGEPMSMVGKEGSPALAGRSRLVRLD